MKRLQYLIIVLALGLGSCATAYKSGQTPDDVYYSPAHERPAAYAYNTSSQYGDAGVTVVNTDAQDGVGTEDGSNYVTYNDQDDRGISYTQQIMMFDNPYGFYSPSFYNPYYYSSFYPYSYGFSPAYYGLGSYYPYYGLNSWNFGFGLGFGYGLGYAFNPWYGSLYTPYYGYYSSYYPYYYGGGSKYGYTPRPSNSIGPRRPVSSGGGYISTGSVPAPVRTFNTTGTASPRRTFTGNGETPVITNPATGVRSTTTPRVGTRRVFRSGNDERPVNVINSRNGTTRVFNSNVEVSRPAPVNTAPRRTFETNNYNSAPRQSAPSYNNSSSSGSSSAPVRTFSPRR